ncbi:unnamed protein product [Cylindrotheca closterium]|uniref:Uncharacterized protein n=1 Tax=Cylindrotheca closterium TaxID=2856 RepID=A0AAD2JPK1_9STRA|nr:unnamed protein product [Cylindrotheca closterium]
MTSSETTQTHEQQQQIDDVEHHCRTNTTTTTWNLQIFQIWMLVISLLFGGSSASLLYLYEMRLRPNARQAEVLTNRSMTLIIGYAYTRMILHVSTGKLLAEHSETFQLLAKPMNDDCAFILEPNSHVWVDRALQLTVHSRRDRLIHHAVASIWALLVIEWSSSSSFFLNDPSLFVTGAIMEGLAKFSYFFDFVARMNRAFIRNQTTCGECWESKAIVGADILFISKTARKQAQFMKLGFGVFLLAHFVAPFALVGVYLGSRRESTIVAWKLALPFIFVLFNLLDTSQYKALRKQSEYA